MSWYAKVITILLIPVVGYAQTDTAKISSIKKQYNWINNGLSSYTKISKEDTVKTTEGNSVDAWLENGVVKKITAIYYGEMGRLTREYYFGNERLIFFYSEDDFYYLPIYAAKPDEIGKIKSKNEMRLYFNNGVIIKHIVSKGQKLEQKTNTETLSEAKRMLRLIKSSK